MTSHIQASMQQHGILQHNSSRADKCCVAIVNPAGSNGQLHRRWKQMYPYVHEQLGEQGIGLQECYTSGPGSAAVLASHAAAAGVDVVLAVGGDGTIHEVSTRKALSSWAL